MPELEAKSIQAFPMPPESDPPEPEEPDIPIQEPEPEQEASKDDPDLVIKPEPEKETVSDEPQEYSQEEWDALPEEERERITKEYEAATAPVADEAKSTENIKALEVELRQKIENYEKKAVEADKVLTQRLQQLSEAAKLAGPEVKEQFGMLKEIGKPDKTDPNRKAVGFKEQIYFTTQNVPAKRGETPEQHYQRVQQANKFQNDRKNEELLAQQDFFTEQLEPLRPIVEAMGKAQRDGESGEAWRQTFAELKQEMKLPDDENTNTILTEAIKEMGIEVLTQGTSLSPDARKVIARSMVSLKQSGFKPQGTQSKPAFQFSSKRPPQGVLRTLGNGNPPKRPPNTIAGRGTASKPPSTKKGQIVKDAAYYAAGGK